MSFSHEVKALKYTKQKALLKMTDKVLTHVNIMLKTRHARHTDRQR